jgi:predicted outer membrane protein
MAHVNPIQIQKFLKGVDYPASKDALIQNAKKMGADEGVFESLEQLPDEEFETPADVSKAFGQLPDDDTEGAGGHAEPGKHAAAKPAAKAAKPAPHDTGDNQFLAQALQDTMAEIRISELALEKSSNDKVKAFAQTMIDEHRQLERELEQLAKKKKLDLQKELRGEHETATKTLSKLHGEKFDKAFVEQNVKDHDNAIKVFKHYASAAADADVKEFARQGEKMLTRHLKMVKELEKKL